MFYLFSVNMKFCLFCEQYKLCLVYFSSNIEFCLFFQHHVFHGDGSNDFIVCDREEGRSPGSEPDRGRFCLRDSPGPRLHPAVCPDCTGDPGHGICSGSLWGECPFCAASLASWNVKMYLTNIVYEYCLSFVL